MLRKRMVIHFALAVTGVLGLSGPAAAGEQVPFRGVLDGNFTSTPIPGTPNAIVLATGTGASTQLGRFSFDFPLIVHLPSQTGIGIYTFTAANGDTIVADVTAKSSLLPSGLRLVEEIGTIIGGTGRFDGATGGYVGQRLLDRATGDVVGFYDGTITSPGAGNR